MMDNTSHPASAVRFALGLLITSLSTTPFAHADEPISFNRDIRPILTNHCYQCHGPDQEHREADLRFDEPLSAFAQRDGSAAIVPMDPSKSVLMHRILEKDDSLRMPPPDLKKDLNQTQIDLLERWISEGANYEDHWAFITPNRPAIPNNDSTWTQNPIDEFVLSKMRKLGLSPNSAAGKEILLRRITLDLTGMPPTIAEIDSFLSDQRPDAYEAVVLRLLNSPRFGERMAVDWMDAARYGDSSVFHADGPRDMWAWRDWVIRAFNSNKSYKAFTMEQIAGDLLPEPTVDQLVASGFNRNHGTTDEGGAIAEEYRVEYIVDRIKTTSTVWLGLTLECAQCHDHKYDPFSQEEYYQLFAYFNQASDRGMQTRRGNEPPVVQVPNLKNQAKLPQANTQLEGHKSDVEQYRISAEDAYNDWLTTVEEEAKQGPQLPEGRQFFIDFTEQEGTSVAANNQPASIGSFKGTPQWISDDSGTAVQLDGKSFVEYAKDLANYEGTEAFSFGAFIKPTKNLSGAILSRMKDSNNFKGYDFLLSGGKIEVHIISQWPANAIKVTSKDSVIADKLQHVMLTYDGSRKASGIALYIDGKAQELTIQQDSLKDTIKADTHFKVGSRDNSLFFQGLIYSISGYARQLGPEEVKLDAGQDAITPILVKASEDRTAEEIKVLKERYFAQDKQFQALTKRVQAKQQEIDDLNKPLTSVMVMGDVQQMRTTYILDRGNYATPRKDKEILPSIPATLDLGQTDLPLNRLGLAQWLTDSQHPLTSRVTVNRIWQMFFGHGIVKTIGDFGSQGEMPTHPDLLDWLAVDFVESDWNVKRLIYLIATSATYQQSSYASNHALSIDSANRYYSRGPRFRLQAEFIRDTALAAGGLLLNDIGGPGVKPYQPAGLWNEVSLSGNVRFKQDEGANNYRRSMYTYWKRSAPAPAMTIFDVPTREKCVVQRPRTNTPLQALVTLNDPQYLEAARGLGNRMLQHSEDVPQQLAYGYRLATGRTPTPQTLQILNDYLDSEITRFRDDQEAARKFLSLKDDTPTLTTEQIQQAAYTLLSNLLLNLDATITRG